MDCFEEKGLGSDRSSGEYPDPDFDGTKSCADCGTQKTPLWRAGPSGPKSLCNACGIRYRKRERSVLGLKVEGKEKKRKERGRMGVSFKGFGHRRWAVIENQNQGMLLPEEEEAAVLLMALSSGLLCSSSKERSRERGRGVAINNY